MISALLSVCCGEGLPTPPPRIVSRHRGSTTPHPEPDLIPIALPQLLLVRSNFPILDYLFYKFVFNADNVRFSEGIDETLILCGTLELPSERGLVKNGYRLREPRR